MRTRPILVSLFTLLFAAACGGGGGGGGRNNKPPANLPPTIAPITSPQTAEATIQLVIPVMATDPEGDTLILSAGTLPANANFNDNGGGMGTFDITADASQIGQSYLVTFMASDSVNGPATRDVIIDVVPAPNLPPVITPIPDPQTVIAGSTVAFQMMATDPNGDIMTLNALPLPANATFQDLGGGVGNFSFSPDVSQCGQSFVIVFTADDGINPASSQNVQFDVTSNSPILNQIPTPRQVPELVQLGFTVRATDPDGDPVTLTAMPLPLGGGFVDNGDGTGDFTITPGTGTSGTTYTVTFTAADTCSAPVSQDVDITVIAPNAPPVLDPIVTPQAVSHGNTLNLSLSATDPDGDPLTFSIAPLLANSTMTSTGTTTADFSFTPDFTQSGNLQIAFRVSDPFNPPDTQIVQINVTGNGNGTFTEVLPGGYAFALRAWTITSGDVNDDGNVDLITAENDASNPGLVILLGDGTGNFTITGESPYALTGASADPIPISVTAADFDQDGALDVALATQEDGAVYIFMGDAPTGTPDGTFTENTAALISLGMRQSFHVIAGELTGDGNPDLVVGAVDASGDVHVLIGDGTGSFTLSPQSPLDTSLSLTTGLVHSAIADYNNDSILDIVPVNLLDSVFHVFLGDDDGTGKNSAGTFTQGSGTVMTPTVEPGLPSTADFNNDGAFDVAVPHFSTPAEFTVWLGNGFGLFSQAPAFPTFGDSAEYSATGDFNGDGNADLTATEVGTDTLNVFLGAGDGTFTIASGSPFTLSGSGRYIAVNDYNNDNLSDIAVIAQGTGSVHVFLGN